MLCGVVIFVRHARHQRAIVRALRDVCRTAAVPTTWASGVRVPAVDALWHRRFGAGMGRRLWRRAASNGRRNVSRVRTTKHGRTVAPADRRTVGVVLFYFFPHVAYPSHSTTTTTNQTIDSVWLCACGCAFSYVNACPERARVCVCVTWNCVCVRACVCVCVNRTVHILCLYFIYIQNILIYNICTHTRTRIYVYIYTHMYVFIVIFTYITYV